MRDTNALNFLTLYIKKVLQDSGLLNVFNDFLNNQNKESFKKLKDIFIDFTIKHIAINGKTECGRIFTKILNPLAFINNKKGTRRGFLSSTIITFDELKYNRINWRDKLSGKYKHITRIEYEQINPQIRQNANYQIQKAKKIVHRYNDKFNNKLSEIKQVNERAIATQIHYIFPNSEFPQISDYIENLIALTLNQHFLMVHPNNQTTYIDKDFQYICLIAKTHTIMNDTTQTYNFDCYKFVLNTGLNTDKFSEVVDYHNLILLLDYFYPNFNNKKFNLI
ncbi:iron permease [Campylobacter sp. LR291e]